MDPNNPNPPQQPQPGGYPPPQQPPPGGYPPPQQPAPQAYPPPQPAPSGAYLPPQQPQPSGAYPPPAGYPPQMPPSGAYPSPAGYPPSNAYPPPSGAYPPPGAFPPPYQPQNQAQASQLPGALASFTTGDWLVGGGAVLLLIASFLPWYSYSSSIYNISFNAWSAWPGTIAAFLGIEILVLMGLRMAHMRLVLPISDKVFNMAVGVAIAILSLLYLAIVGNNSGINLGSSGFGPSFGLFIGVLCGLAIAAGGYLQVEKPVA